MSRLRVSSAVALVSALCLSACPSPASSVARPVPPDSTPLARTTSRGQRDAAPSPDGRAPSAFEAQFVVLLNQERTRRGLRPLVWEPSLCVAGRQHSEEMARLSYFDHRSPTAGLETPADRWERIVSRTPDEYVIGENLFFGSAVDVRWGHGALMESSAHRANILNPDFTRIGVGVHVDRKGQMWVTQMFLS